MPAEGTKQNPPNAAPDPPVRRAAGQSAAASHRHVIAVVALNFPYTAVCWSHSGGCGSSGCLYLPRPSWSDPGHEPLTCSLHRNAPRRRQTVHPSYRASGSPQSLKQTMEPFTDCLCHRVYFCCHVLVWKFCGRRDSLRKFDGAPSE